MCSGEDLFTSDCIGWLIFDYDYHWLNDNLQRAKMVNQRCLREFIFLLLLVAVTQAQSVEVGAEKSMVLVKAFNTDKRSSFK